MTMIMMMMMLELSHLSIINSHIQLNGHTNTSLLCPAQQSATYKCPSTCIAFKDYLKSKKTPKNFNKFITAAITHENG